MMRSLAVLGGVSSLLESDHFKQIEVIIEILVEDLISMAIIVDLGRHC